MSKQGRTRDDDRSNSGNIVFYVRFGDTTRDKKRQHEALVFHQARKARRAAVRAARSRHEDERGVSRRTN